MNYFFKPTLTQPPLKVSVFSLPEMKTQVSFSDHNLSVVHRCRRCCFSRRNILIFSFSSPEPLC